MSVFSPSSFPPELQQALAMAQAYRQGGRPAEAEALCRQQLVRYPGQPALLAALGELLLQRGDAGAALPLLEQACQRAPGPGAHWLLLTQCLLALERHGEAKKCIGEAIGKGLRHPLADELLRQARAGGRKKPAGAAPSVSLGERLRQLDAWFRAGRHAEVEKSAGELLARHPGSPQAWFLLGMAVLSQRRFEDALTPFRRALALDGGLAAAHFNLGFALESLERLDEALAAYRQAAAANPRLADAHNNQGNVLQKLKRHAEALAAYDQAVARMPKFAPFRMNRGDALRDLERMDEAAEAYQAAVELNPGQFEAYVSLAYACLELGRLEDAVSNHRRALALRPDSADTHAELGRVLGRLGRHEEMIESFRRALQLKPGDAGIGMRFAKALDAALRVEEALAVARPLLEADPGSIAATNLVAGLLRDAGREGEALAVMRRGMALNPQDCGLHGNYVFQLNCQPGVRPEALLAEARAYGEKAAGGATPFLRHDNAPQEGRRLRVGFVSGDLGQHPVGFFLRNVLQNIDPATLELFAYETHGRKDEVNQALRQAIPNWRRADAAKMSDEALAHRIRADGIDILVDLAGHTSYNRLPVFAWKPAPLQVSWLGYLGTTGLKAMDYILADARALPAGEEAQFVEKVWRLPDTYLCFSPPQDGIEVGGLPALEKGWVTFGCFNNLHKINDGVLACWARILRAVPDARLYVKTRNLGAAEVREKFIADFAAHGIGPERLILEGQFASHEEHFRAYGQVDIALDPFPYPGITTTVEALWMAVPVLTLKGDRFISHQGATILGNAGLAEWVAEDVDDYVARAISHAGDIEGLSRLRARLRQQVLASPLFDAPRFARNLEAAFREMWREWCATQRGEEGSANA